MLDENTLVKCGLLTTTGTINSARLRREKFINSTLCADIIAQTGWMDTLSPTVGHRIKAILLRHTEVVYCKCGRPCAISNVRTELFKKTCGTRECVILESQYIRTDQHRETTSKTKIQNYNGAKSDMIKYYNSMDATSDSIMSRSQLKLALLPRFNVLDNNCIFSQTDYIDNKSMLCSIIFHTKYIPVDSKNLKWSNRLYDILNDVYAPTLCQCGKPVSYINRKYGYRDRCLSCVAEYSPYIRAKNSVDRAIAYLGNEYEITHRPTGLNHGMIGLRHKTCDTTFDYRINNGKWKKVRCPSCDAQTSKPEEKVREYINRFATTEKIRIDNLEIDIFDRSRNIGIEVNGLYWHSEEMGKGRKYHLRKTELCERNGIRLLHIFEDEINDQWDIVKSRLDAIFNQKNYKLYARKCTIKEINGSVCSAFLDKYHLQGQCRSKVKLGAYYKNRLVAVMTFGHRRFDNKAGYELMRFATISKFSCVGVAGKLLTHFERKYSPCAIITYADRRWSQGGLYDALGFVFSHHSSPNYFYLKGGVARQSRHKYQKHKLESILPTFDAANSEYENMKMNGYSRIWDCGTLVYQKSPVNYPQAKDLWVLGGWIR